MDILKGVDRSVILRLGQLLSFQKDLEALQGGGGKGIPGGEEHGGRWLQRFLWDGGRKRETEKASERQRETETHTQRETETE